MRKLNACEYVVIRSHRTDKYARYLADVFYMPGEGDAHVVAKEGVCLNQELLDKRLATVWVG